jgi:DNA-binding NtrC family response regulator
MKFFIHIIDDEATVAHSIKRILQAPDRVFDLSHSAQEALQKAQNANYDLFLLDYRLGNSNGIALLKRLKEIAPEALFIIITAYGTIEIAVQAMKLGAFDFIQKDQNPDVMRFTVQRALDTLRLRKEVEDLRYRCITGASLPQIVAESPAMKQVMDMAEKYAETDSTILITGETGTGKNLLAEYIHHKSPRFMYPFTAINSCAIPPNLMESELFGYEKGAFTGAKTNGKIGLIERSNHGTLFLDEIGELTLELQAKLLHVIERQEFYRIGSVESQKINVRIIAATNVDLQEMVENKQFRLDLFYRLNVATIQLPPLRHRKEDIVPLTKLFIEEFNARFNKNVHRLTNDAVQFLVNAPWQGNIRELKNLIERVMILIEGDTLTYDEILRAFNPFSMNHNENNAAGFFNLNLMPENGKNLIQKAQKELVRQALKKTKGNRSSAARLLGIPRTTLNFYLEKFEITDSE